MNLFKNENNKYNNKENFNINENNQNNQNNQNNKYNNNSNIFDKKTQYIEDLQNDKIYNINFTSYITIISSNTPNYTYEWNHNDNTLNFYSLCNNNNDFINIVVNYNILKANFQLVLYVWLNEIVKCPLTIFKIKWNKLADKINKFSQKSENDITTQEINKITKDIANICGK